MPPSAAVPAHSNGKGRRTMGLRNRPPCEPNQYAGEVTLLTAAQFAKSTKSTQSSAREQEEQLRDLFVLIRHGERQDHADRAWKGNALLPLYDPPLSNAGRMQTFETALQYYALRKDKKVEQRIQGTFTMFLVSPFHRCIETAALMDVVAFEGKLPVYVEPLLSDWQQSKVFRTPPVLGGTYVCRNEPSAGAGEGDQLHFNPQVDALRVALIPFLRTKAVEEEELLGEYNISAEVASSWAFAAEQWLDEHAILPVWTCATTASAVKEKLASSVGSSADEKRMTGRTTKSIAMPSNPCGDGCEAHNGCGVAHPESKTDLLRRCEQVVSTHFLRSPSAQSEAMVPWAVQNAVLVEQRTRLPKYFQTWEERSVEDRDVSGPPALLPPMHVMAITHADVVSTLLETCCPKYHDKGAGYSVPYCSITTLQRHNNYYRIPTAEERQRKEANMSTQVLPHKFGKVRAKKKACAQLSRNQLGTSFPVRPSAPLSVEWNVASVGSTDLLRTRIVIQYNK